MAAEVPAPTAPRAAAGFRLLRYFTSVSLAAFAAVAVAMVLVEHAERDLFKRVQSEQAASFREVLETFAQRQAAAAQRDLLRMHEAGHVNLTRLFANVLWARDFAPLVMRAQAIDVARCRSLAQELRPGCHRAAGAAIRALPGFRMLDARVAETMRKTAVFKIKVFDLRGVTIYSSEHAQIGEDKLRNQGWISAVAGQAASELTHRDRFSAFEGAVEDRDLISSYIPVREPGGERVLGVFEIYSDVTSFLEQIHAASAGVRKLNAEYQLGIERTAAGKLEEMDGISSRLLAIVGALLVMLYAALYLVARHAQGIIDRREREREAAIEREQYAHREKIAALNSMAADVAHEIANPLAVIASYAEQTVPQTGHDERRACPPKALLEQVQRISVLLRRIAEFTREGSERRETVDVNRSVKSVCDFMAYDPRFRATRIDFRGAHDLPACIFMPDQLTEVVMNLLQVCAEGGDAGRPRRPEVIEVRTGRRGDATVIRIGFDPRTGGSPERPEGPRIEATRRIVAAMGGLLVWPAAPHGGLEIVLPGVDPATTTLA